MAAVSEEQAAAAKRADNSKRCSSMIIPFFKSVLL
jgi:hypothetical protein